MMHVAVGFLLRVANIFLSDWSRCRNSMLVDCRQSGHHQTKNFGLGTITFHKTGHFATAQRP